MFQTLPCPGCQRTLVLATEASLQAVLRCRHCSKQFTIGEMIEAELGYWEVVEDPNAPPPKASGDGEVAADDAVLELSMSEEYVSPQTLLKKQAEKKKVDWSKFEPITHEQYERMRRKAKSPIWSMLSVLLGGLASIPIATLLIWHVLGKDPLQMGPVVGRYAPWIVPTRFQSNDRKMDEEIPQALPPGGSGFRRFDDVMNESPSDSNGEAKEDAEKTSVAGGVPATTAQSRPFRIRDRRVPRAFPALSDAPDASSDGPPVDVPENRDASNEDVFTLINLVEKDIELWNERGEDRETHKKLAMQTYSDLAALALAIDQLPPASPLRRLVRTELLSVGQQVAQHADIQQLIQSGARYWLTTHPSGQVGLAVVVNVENVSEVDNVWQITPTTAAGDERFGILIPKELLATVSAGKKILILGTLSRNNLEDKSQPRVPSDPAVTVEAGVVAESPNSPVPTEPQVPSPAPVLPVLVLNANHVHMLEP